MVEAEVRKATVIDVEDRDHEEALDLEVDEGELLNCIVHKILLASKFKMDNQRNRIFRTHGTINVKVCNVIIDGGSSENRVSKALVDVIGLSTEKHLAPYGIGWLKKWTEMRVTEVYRVSFSIGKIYKSDVVCHVVDMNACHLLLGRPWQFDVDAVHRKGIMYTGFGGIARKFI